MTKELNIVDQDLKQMTKRQKCSSTNSSGNNLTNSNSNENPSLSSSSTNEKKDDQSSASIDATTVNDTVPNWTQSGGQVRIKCNSKLTFRFGFSKDLHATPDMKTNKQQVASSSSILSSSATTKNEIAPAGAVVRFAFFSHFDKNKQKIRSRKKPISSA